ncbi:MAG TPA: LPS assembly lipoprotein LptE [Thermodesulfovibrionales bacterium]|nr:LPS assembly lipoprotein LptE [Thermodesulfovibrionales bacterium]
MRKAKSIGQKAERIGHRAQRCFLSLTLCTLLLTLCVGGCGYTLQGRAQLPFQSVSIGKIVNKTFESKIEDRMQVALADELLKNGFTLEKGAEHRIEGVLRSFEMRVVAEKSGVADQYEVVIKGDFKLVDSSGKEKPLRGSGAFIVSFVSTGSIPDVMARKEVATDQALRDLALEIVASMIYF